MSYFAKETIFQVITNLANVKYIAGKKGNIDTLPIYLFLSKLGISSSKWITHSELYQDQELGKLSIYELGGMFDLENEIGNSNWCLFLTRFSDKNKQFYNPKTNFNSIFSRVKDTIDNSISDHLLEKGKDKTYRLKSTSIRTRLEMYDQKFSLSALIIWLYRCHSLENFTNFDDLKEYFYQDYKLNYNQVKQLFDVQDSIKIKFSEQKIKAQESREYLEIDNLVDLDYQQSNSDLTTKFSILFSSEKTYLNKYMMLTENKLWHLLNKYKQLILTGVPGTGKSFIIDRISEKYNNILKVQFHQNYTYQEFIYGKTIENNSIKYVPGVLIKFLQNVDTNSNQNKKYLLVIDEINRGNISAIFGELLYVLDRDKSIDISLSDDDNEKFTIQLPPNLHIIGTMNSADRSIALVDFAVRRRFIFVEMQPDYQLIDRLSSFNCLSFQSLGKSFSIFHFCKGF